MTKEGKFEEFYYTLKTKTSLFQVEKLGILDATINVSNIAKKDTLYNFTVKDFLVFNQLGVMVLQYNFSSYVKENPKCIDYIRKSVIKFASADNFKESLFVFQKVYLNKIKIYFMKASGLIFVSISDDRVKAHYCKLYLLHMYIAFINFNGDLIEKVKLIKLNDKNKISNNELNDFFEFKIYEVYFVKYLTNHFERVFRHIIKKEEMYLSYIKFKNMYVVDLSSQEILFDMSAIRNSKKNKKIYKNEKLWMELMHHSRSLMEAYITQCDYEFTMQDSLYRFVKFECTSTYPRYTFIIKFLPILKGISIIHVYTQNKLSRMNDPNDNHHTAKGYKELDILYGSDVKNNHNLEFRYTEPKKLQEIEKFFIEFFLSIRTFCDIFYDVNRELKYFNYKIVKAINDIPDIHPGSVDNLLSKIKAKLYELNLNIITNGANQVVNTKSPKHNLNNEGNISRLFLISQEEILNDLFQPSHPRHISPSSSKSEGEFIKTKGLGFKKGVDGWLIRTESINTNNEYKTLSLSKVEHIPDIKDTSIDLPLRVSVINQNESDSEILFKKKITPVFEKQYETLDDIVNELEKSNRQDRNNRGSERLVNLSGFTPNKLSNLNIGNSNKPISPVILVSNTNYQPLNMKLHYKKRTGTVQLTNNTLGQKLVLLESKVSPLINNDDNIRVSSAKMLKFEELKVASSKKLIEKDDIPQFHND